jgi:ABC-2 type transport system ATP-binding protein
VNPPVIIADRVSRWYGDVIGLNDVSVEIGPGITGLLGPNGAGKSSFLRIMSGELRPSSGRAEVFGSPPFANAQLHRRMGYSPEGDSFFDRMRARDFVVHLLRLSGYAARDAAARADRALEDVGMARAARTRLAACSKGMRQRIKLAQAIAHDPELLLLDEPLSGLDPLARQTIQELIRARAAAGATVVVSSHVLHEVETLTTSILLINKGRIAATGEVSEIRSLIDRHPHRIRIETPHARLLAARLLPREDVRAVRFDDGAVIVETTDPEGVYGLLPALVVETGSLVTGVTSPDDHLEAVFDYLVNG